MEAVAKHCDRAFATRQPLVLAELARVRGTMRRQLDIVFADELAALPADRRRAASAAADVMTSWESFDLMRHDQGLARADATAAMAAALVALLASPAPDTGSER